MRRIFISLVSIIMVLACSNDSNEATLDPIFKKGIAIINAFPNLSFSRPLDLQSPPDSSNRIFVGEQGGIIKVFSKTVDAPEASIFLDISRRITSTGELGLLGFTFHPSYETNGYVFVTYTPSTNLAVISRFTVSATNPNEIDEGSETIILRIPQPQTNHNGGQLAFGPDGFLYISSGDGGGAGDPNGNAQNLSNLLGAILRIDVDTAEDGLAYAIPNDNPFVGIPNVRSEIYAYGLRNPWRFSFDVQTNNLFAGDVGQGEKEEINSIEIGGNYGWNILEGTTCFGNNECDISNTIAPIFEYGHENNDRSITGGYVYRGSAISNLEGYYVYGDFVSGRIWALDPSGNNQLLLETGLNISSFGTDQNNELYLCSFDGSIYGLQGGN